MQNNESTGHMGDTNRESDFDFFMQHIASDDERGSFQKDADVDEMEDRDEDFSEGDSDYDSYEDFKKFQEDSEEDDEETAFGENNEDKDADDLIKEELNEDEDETEDGEGEESDEEDLLEPVDVIGDLADDAVISVGEEQMPVSELKKLMKDKETVNNQAEAFNELKENYDQRITLAEDAALTATVNFNSKWAGFDLNLAKQQYDKAAAMNNTVVMAQASQVILAYEADYKSLAENATAIQTAKSVRSEMEKDASIKKLIGVEKELRSGKWRRETGLDYDSEKTLPDLVNFLEKQFGMSKLDAARSMNPDFAVAVQKLKNMEDAKRLKREKAEAIASGKKGVKKAIKSTKPSKRVEKKPISNYANEDEEFKFFQSIASN